MRDMLPKDGQLVSPLFCRFRSSDLCRIIRFACAAILFLIMLPIPVTSQAQTKQQLKPRSSNPIPEPAIPAILGAFDNYEVVAMPEDHGLKDLDDLILSLIRNRSFPDKVNDLLDRYITGDDVPLAEARKVWRNTDQPICGGGGSDFSNNCTLC